MRGPELSGRICVGTLLCLLVLPSVSLATGQGNQDKVSLVGRDHPLYEIASAMGFDDARIMAVLQDPQIEFEEALNRIIGYPEAARNSPEGVGIEEPSSPVRNDNVKLQDEEMEDPNLDFKGRTPEGAHVESDLFNELAQLGYRKSDIISVLQIPDIDFQQALHMLWNDGLDRDESEKAILTSNFNNFIRDEEEEDELTNMQPPLIVENHEAKLEEEERENFNLESQISRGKGASVDRKVLAELLDLGFLEEDIITVLSKPGVNLEEAVTILLEDDPVQALEERVWMAPEKDKQEEVREESLAQSEEVIEEPDIVAELREFGFSWEAIEEVLLIPGIDLDEALLTLANQELEIIKRIQNRPAHNGLKEEKPDIADFL